MRALDPAPLDEPVMRSVGRYPLPEVGVVLVRLEAGETHVATTRELALDMTGDAWYLEPGDELTARAATFVVTS